MSGKPKAQGEFGTNAHHIRKEFCLGCCMLFFCVLCLVFAFVDFDLFFKSLICSNTMKGVLFA